MTFHWALSEMQYNGAKVRRKAWAVSWSKLQEHCWLEKSNSHTILRFLFGNKLMGDDLVAEDWEEHRSEGGKD